MDNQLREFTAYPFEDSFDDLVNKVEVFVVDAIDDIEADIDEQPEKQL